MSALQDPGGAPAGAVWSVFTRGGETGRLCRETDWGSTPLGPVDAWPHALRTTAALVLGSGFPMILVWGPELVQLYNDAYVPLIGRKHPDALAMPTHECWPEIRHIQEPIFRRVFAGETVNLNEALYPLARNGTVENLYFDATFVPVPLENGEIGGCVSTLFEVTARVAARPLEAERERLFREAEAARTEAEAANRAKADFLASMSHELRTPLNAVGAYVDLLDMGIHGPVTEAQRKALSRITANQRHLLTLINDILAYAKIEAGQVDFDLRPLRVCDLLTGVEPFVAPQAQAKGIACSIRECDPELALVGDEERVRQILLNLVGNAVKFTPSGGWVVLSCDEEPGWVNVRVRDNGPGIRAEKHRTIFDPFVQGDRRLDSPQEGVGLGLAISRDLARGMGGELSVESEPGEGSRFTLRLPRAGTAADQG